jgi:hypothetical protein
MGAAVRPAKTSPGPWDAFADADVFVDDVLAELTAMARDGTRPQRSRPKPPLVLQLRFLGSVVRLSRSELMALSPGGRGQDEGRAQGRP